MNLTVPPKALDEDESDFLDALETVSMANCGGTASLSWGYYLILAYIFLQKSSSIYHHVLVWFAV